MPATSIRFRRRSIAEARPTHRAREHHLALKVESTAGSGAYRGYQEPADIGLPDRNKAWATGVLGDTARSGGLRAYSPSDSPFFGVDRGTNETPEPFMVPAARIGR